MTSLQEISALISARSPALAAKKLQALVRIKDAPAVDWQGAMQLAGLLGDQESALFAAQNWSAQQPNDPQRIISVINALGAVAKNKQAAELARKLQTKPSAAADGYLLEGVYQAQSGDFVKAQELFRQSLKLNPDQGSAWEQLGLLNAYENIDTDIQTMESLTRRLTAPEQIIPLHYALGRAYDHAGDIDKAFAAFSVGGALREKTTPFNIEWALGYADRLKQSFSGDYIRERRLEKGGENHILMVSAARSGSTLLEQILATSPHITPTGEHGLMRLATLSLGAFEPRNLAQAETFKTEDWQSIAQVYVEGVRSRFGASRYYTDKTIINHYYAGVARIVLPNAKVVWCKRDPKDVAWSCFRSRIADNRWAHNLDHCVQFIQAHNQLCQHWSDIYSDDLMALSYESLVGEPEKATEKLFDHIGAAKPDHWNRFHENSGAVATASIAQVRKPINKKAVGAWKKYEKHLAPIYDKYFQ